MKRIAATLFILLIWTVTAHAISFSGAPQVINYQGRLTDAGGTPLADGPHGVRFIIWYDSTSTNPLNIAWDSGPTTVTTDKGLFSIKLGSPPQPALSYIPFYDSLLFLGITVGADPEIAPRTRLTSVPFAMSATNAVTAQTAGTAYFLVPSSMPAAGTVSLSLTGTTSTTPATLGQFTVTSPGSGYLMINVSGMFYINADATSANSLTAVFSLGLCTSPASSATCDFTYTDHYVQDADNVDANNQTPTVSLNSTFPTPGAGNYTFYINGNTSNAAYELWPWEDVKVNVLFVPNTLTITSPAPNNPTTGPRKQQ